MTNAEKYAEQIAQVIAESKSLAVCKAFQKVGREDCTGCPMRKIDCNNTEWVESWLKEENVRK